jgi:hypothetical protein
MKKLFTTLFIVAGLLSQTAIAAEPVKKETKQVCIDVKDKNGNVVKDAKGKVKQNCKTMKVHKKLEGTEVPVKK